MIKEACCYLTLLLAMGCQSFKPVGLYDAEAPAGNVPGINNFYSLRIFEDQITNDLWFSPEQACLQVRNESTEFHNGSGAISIEWNKQAGNCTWIGMGIGWDNWTGKDMSSVLNSAALSFWAKMKKGQSSGLPWAVGFEDFTGNQAWTGVTSGCVVGGVVKDTWTQVIIPLENFPFEGRDVDVSSIKQVIFQFESSGKLWVDDISIVPYTPISPMQAAISRNLAPTIDGVFGIGEWKGSIRLDNSSFWINADDSFLYLAAEVKDPTPLMNNNDNENIWNGDALEIAFSTLHSADPKRKIFYISDHHIGIRMSEDPGCYNWSLGKALDDAVVRVKKYDWGYTAEAAIPWSELQAQPWQAGNTYGFELALDVSDDTGKRQQQIRWNSNAVEGFNFNPSLWGSIRIKP